MNRKTRKEARSKERLARNQVEPSIYRLTLETLDNPNLELIMYPGKIAEAKRKGGAKVAPEVADDPLTTTGRRRRADGFGRQDRGDRSGTRRDAEHPQRPCAAEPRPKNRQH